MKFPCFDNMVGQSASMLNVFDMIMHVARGNASVLITGESGTGKELVARSIHGRSRRRNKPFVPVNCSALPEQLFEGELFGYERGAFTGAHRRKQGLFEYADGGTLFLDEVCEMPVNLQPKILRVLQEKNLRRIGGTRQIEIDFRLNSAANIPLQDALVRGSLREDLFFRINVVNIHLPPLRERCDDIGMLAEFFLQRHLKSSPKDIIGFDKDVLELFNQYHWPGNIRELENIVVGAIALETADKIGIVHIPVRPTRSKTRLNSEFANETFAEAKQNAIESFEKKYLRTFLERHDGNVSRIARQAGLTRRHLHRLLLKHEFDATAWQKQAKRQSESTPKP